jgi:glucan phosphoethanolaminetransferase (alkaline phosphatase superfamily)
MLTIDIPEKIQLILFLLFIGILLVFIKLNSYEKRIKELEDSLTNYVPYEDFMELFNNMVASTLKGEDVSPFQASQDDNRPLTSPDI